jgi:hypothetical protein
MPIAAKNCLAASNSLFFSFGMLLKLIFLEDAKETKIDTFLYYIPLKSFT